LGLKGKLLLGFSSPRKEDVNEIEFQHEQKWQLKAIRRFQSAKNRLFEEYGVDYLFIDTSPGIRYWAINTLATANMLFLIMKVSDMDIEGTKKMVIDIYDVLTRYGKSKYYIILNKVPGASPTNDLNWGAEEKTWQTDLEKDIGAQIIGSVPCFCDIQFSRHEFLSAVKQPDHLFSKRLVSLAERIRGLG